MHRSGDSFPYSVNWRQKDSVYLCVLIPDQHVFNQWRSYDLVSKQQQQLRQSSAADCTVECNRNQPCLLLWPPIQPELLLQPAPVSNTEIPLVISEPLVMEEVVGDRIRNTKRSHRLVPNERVSDKVQAFSTCTITKGLQRVLLCVSTRKQGKKNKHAQRRDFQRNFRLFPLTFNPKVFNFFVLRLYGRCLWCLIHTGCGFNVGLR